MDVIEKWLVDQAQQFEDVAREAVLLVATRWHDEGPNVMVKQLEMYGAEQLDQPRSDHVE